MQLGDKSDHLDLVQGVSRDIVSDEADTGNNQLLPASVYYALVAIKMAASTSQITKSHKGGSGLLLGSDEDLSHDIGDEELELFEGPKSEAVTVDWNLTINIAIKSESTR